MSGQGLPSELSPRSPDDARRDVVAPAAAGHALRGEFTLRSGRKSNYYLDKYRFETHPDILRELGLLFSQHVGPAIDRIAQRLVDVANIRRTLERSAWRHGFCLPERTAA